MTLTLILTRHAKSGWDDPNLDDHDRPLSDRGRRQAPLMGRWLAERGHIPNLALVSSAKRTRQTWELLAEHLPGAEADIRKTLYLAAPAGILDALKSTTEKSVLVLAHNPGIARTAEALVSQTPDDEEFARFPTLATAVIEFDAEDWADAAQGKLLDFTVPRRLE